MTDRATFTRFEDSTKAEWDNIMQCMKHTQSLVPDRILEQLRHLASDDGGFPVSRLEHSLQTATRAMRGGEKMSTSRVPSSTTSATLCLRTTTQPLPPPLSSRSSAKQITGWLNTTAFSRAITSGITLV